MALCFCVSGVRGAERGCSDSHPEHLHECSLVGLARQGAKTTAKTRGEVCVAMAVSTVQRHP